MRAPVDLELTHTCVCRPRALIIDISGDQIGEASQWMRKHYVFKTPDKTKFEQQFSRGRRTLYTGSAPIALFEGTTVRTGNRLAQDLRAFYYTSGESNHV